PEVALMRASAVDVHDGAPRGSRLRPLRAERLAVHADRLGRREVGGGDGQPRVPGGEVVEAVALEGIPGPVGRNAERTPVRAGEARDGVEAGTHVLGHRTCGGRDAKEHRISVTRLRLVGDLDRPAGSGRTAARRALTRVLLLLADADERHAALPLAPAPRM